MCYVDNPLAALRGTPEECKLVAAIMVLVSEAIGIQERSIGPNRYLDRRRYKARTRWRPSMSERVHDYRYQRRLGEVLGIERYIAQGSALVDW